MQEFVVSYYTYNEGETEADEVTVRLDIFVKGEDRGDALEKAEQVAEDTFKNETSFMFDYIDEA